MLNKIENKWIEKSLLTEDSCKNDEQRTRRSFLSYAYSFEDENKDIFVASSNGYVLHALWSKNIDANQVFSYPVSFEKPFLLDTENPIRSRVNDFVNVSNYSVFDLDLQELLHAVNIAHVFSRDFAHSTRFLIKGDVLQVFGRSYERGDARTAICIQPISFIHHEYDFSFDANLLRDTVSIFKNRSKVQKPLRFYVPDTLDKGVGIGTYGDKLGIIMMMSKFNDECQVSYVREGVESFFDDNLVP